MGRHNTDNYHRKISMNYTRTAVAGVIFHKIAGFGLCNMTKSKKSGIKKQKKIVKAGLVVL